MDAEATQTWHIVHNIENIGLVDPAELEEVVVIVQGIIHQHDLPPFMETIRYATQTKPPDLEIHGAQFSLVSASIRYLCQSVSITGLGSQAFEAACTALAKVHVQFSCYIPAGKLNPLPATENYRGSSTIELSNCYLLTRQKVRDEVHIPFMKDINPKGVLTHAVGNQYLHSEKNVVQYCKLLHRKDGAVQ